jgi:NAD-dependent dihydropyrimidine dehydrogenase PreA subunit
MITKPFYEQLKKTEKVSICGMFPKTSVSHNEQGMPYFAPGYTIRATGDIKEISFKAIYQHDGQFIIDHTKCDVCGDCYTICPTSAVEIVIDHLI